MNRKDKIEYYINYYNILIGNKRFYKGRTSKETLD